MAKVVIVGGGFAGVVAAESLAKKLGDEHEVTLVSRSRKFLFYPALVRLAFGEGKPHDISFDIRKAMMKRRIGFVEGEVARIYPDERQIRFAHGEFVGDMPYDYLVLAPGRRLKTEEVSGFFEHAHHLLSVRATQQFGAAVQKFEKGKAVIGYCSGARLPVPVFETAFALSLRLQELGRRKDCTITIVSGETPDEMFGGVPMSEALEHSLKSHRIRIISDFQISRVTPNSIVAVDGRKEDFNLNMLIPPFGGPGSLVGTGLTDAEGYARVERTMRVAGLERVYAAGDCVGFHGPKMGHMAVRQGEVVAENLEAEIRGRELPATYDHEMMLVLDAGGGDAIFVQKDLGSEDPADIQNSRFWGWAKRKQEQYWKLMHA